MLNSEVLKLFQSVPGSERGKHNTASLLVYQDLKRGDMSVLAQRKASRITISLAKPAPEADRGGSALQSGAQREAADTIVRILLDSKGNSSVAVSDTSRALAANLTGGDDRLTADVGQSTYLNGGRGDDVITIRAGANDSGSSGTVKRTYAGSGDDSVAISSSGSVSRTYLGSGNDTLSIASAADIDRTKGGGGDDSLTLAARGSIDRTYGGTGDDTILIASDEGIRLVDGGKGDDMIFASSAGAVQSIRGGRGDDTIGIQGGGAVYDISGGRGDDLIDVNAGFADLIDGGSGDDLIRVSADEIGRVRGGRGDDIIQLNSTTGRAATVFMADGDGNDMIEANGPVALQRVSDDGTTRLDPDLARMTVNDDGSVLVSFEGSNDTLTLRFSGEMADRTISMESIDGQLVFGTRDAASDLAAGVGNSQEI